MPYVIDESTRSTSPADTYADLAQTGNAPPLSAAGIVPLPLIEPVVELTPTPVPPPPGSPGVPLPGKPSGLGLRKFRDVLPIPPVLRITDADAVTTVRATLMSTRLHADLPDVTMWGYNGSLPGPTIEVDRGVRARIDWVNDLGCDGSAAHLPYDVVRVPAPPRIDADGNPVPDGVAVANFAETMRPGGRSTSRAGGPDAFPPLEHTEELVAATVVHLHGALTNGHNDGWAHNVMALGDDARTEYPNNQRAATMWYHDHAMAVTRFNVPTGLAGFYLIRDDSERRLGLPGGRYEIPLMIADRNLETLPASAPDTPDPFTGRILYKQAGFTQKQEQYDNGTVGEIPITGPYHTVNGKIWPSLSVEPRWYRFRLLNASSSRIMELALHDTTDQDLGPDESIEPTLPDPANPGGRIPNPAFTDTRVGGMIVIGTDGGLLPHPVPAVGDVIRVGPAERVDVLVDFARFSGRTLELRNDSGTVVNARPTQADASIMQFTVAPGRPCEQWAVPPVLDPDWVTYEHLPNGQLRIGDTIVEHHDHVWVGLIPPGVRGSLHPEMWELQEISAEEAAELPDAEGAGSLKRDLIQLTGADGAITYLTPVAKLFDDTVATTLARGNWAVWNLLHLGGPAHPIHIHMTTFQMLNRRNLPLRDGDRPLFNLAAGSTDGPLPPPTPGTPIDPVLAGSKETYVINSGEWVSVLGHFEGAAGSFMYHCHILDHEDHTMMRPFVVLPKELLAFHGGHGGHH